MLLVSTYLGTIHKLLMKLLLQRLGCVRVFVFLKLKLDILAFVMIGMTDMQVRLY